jgi:ppGpp synthetase/RelA/SpoT-type nucleotidyltranferase
MGSSGEVEKLRKTYLASGLKHKLVGQDDYIANPKFSGYRGIHLVYSYFSDRKETFNGLKIEIQIRTQLQHAWATAVEIVGFFRRELLKSGEGDHVWKHF